MQIETLNKVMTMLSSDYSDKFQEYHYFVDRWIEVKEWDWGIGQPCIFICDNPYFSRYYALDDKIKMLYTDVSMLYQVKHPHLSSGDIEELMNPCRNHEATLKYQKRCLLYDICKDGLSVSEALGIEEVSIETDKSVYEICDKIQSIVGSHE